MHVPRRRRSRPAAVLGAALLAALAGATLVPGCTGGSEDAPAPEADEADEAPAGSGGPLELEVRVGWDDANGLCRPLAHVPVLATILARDEPFEGRLRIAAPVVGAGLTREVTYELPVSVPAGGKKRFEVPVYVGVDAAEIEIALVDAGGGVVIRDWHRPGVARADQLLIAIVAPNRGDHATMLTDGRRLPLFTHPDLLPRNPASLAALDAIVIDAKAVAALESGAVLDALDRYVRDGGHLAIALRPLGYPASNPDFAALLPAARKGSIARFDARGSLLARFPGGVSMLPRSDGGEGGDEDGGEDGGSDGDDDDDDGPDDDDDDGPDLPRPPRARRVVSVPGVLTAFELTPAAPEVETLIRGVRLPEPKSTSTEPDAGDPGAVPPETPETPETPESEPTLPEVPPGPEEGVAIAVTAQRQLGRVTLLGFSLTDGGAERLITDRIFTTSIFTARPPSPLTRRAVDPESAEDPWGLSARTRRVVEDDVVPTIADHLKASTLFAVRPASTVAAFLLLYIFTLVPGLLIVFKGARKVEWFWLALPVVAFGFVYAAWRISEEGSGRTVALTAVEMITVPQGQSHGTSRTVFSLYSPTGRAYDLDLAPGARAVSPPTRQVRGERVPPLFIEEAGPYAPVDAGPTVKTFAILAKDSRLLEIEGPAELGGPVGLVALVPPTGPIGAPSARLENESGTDFVAAVVVHGGRVYELSPVADGALVEISLAENHGRGVERWILERAAQNRAEVARLAEERRRPIEAEAPIPGVSAGADADAADTSWARQSLDVVRSEVMLRLVQRVAAQRLDRSRPYAILASPAPDLKIAIDDRRLETLGWRVLVVEGEVELLRGHHVVDDIPVRLAAQPVRSSSFYNDGGILEWSDGMVVVDIEIDGTPPGFAIGRFSVTIPYGDQPRRTSRGFVYEPEEPVLEERGPDGMWHRLRRTAVEDLPRERRRRAEFESLWPDRPRRVARLRMKQSSVGSAHRVSEIRPILERRVP